MNDSEKTPVWPYRKKAEQGGNRHRNIPILNEKRLTQNTD